MSDNRENQEEEQPQRGPLAPILDPVGNVLGTGLRPVGAVVETVTKPVTKGVGSLTHPVLSPVTGTQDEKAEVIGGKNKDSYAHSKDSVGGRLQTGDNPLGLESTERWGFREEK